MSTEFVLPSLGENVTSGDIVRVMVKPGDHVVRDQLVLELETDKATLEVPSTIEGTVADVKVKAGEKISVGQAVFAVEGDGGAAVAASKPDAAREGRAPASAPDLAGLDMAPEAVAPDLVAVDDSEDAEAIGDVEPEDEPAPAALAPRAEAREATAPAQPAAPIGPVRFALPELGENVAGGDVVRVLVKVGDDVARDQAVLEIETDKATIEVPSSIAGKVTEVYVKEGQTVKVGEPVLLVEGAAAPPEAAQAVQRETASATSPTAGQTAREVPGPEEDDQWPSTDEDGTSEGRGLQQRVPGRMRQFGPDKPGMHEDALAEAAADAAPRPRGEVVSINRGARAAAEPAHPAMAAPASPATRRVARELGVDVTQVPGSGPGGRISSEDVRAYVKRIMLSGGPAAARGPEAPGVSVPRAPLPDFAKWGPVERTPMRAVRRKTAEHLAQAWAEIPHVTQFDKADITALEELRSRYGKVVQASGGKLTVTAVALKVVAAALKVFPQFNASIDVAAGEIVSKHYVHIGVAVDTDRGLIVPVIRDVDKKNVVQLAAELAQASERARTRKTTLEEMEGGCFTISNLGGIGGTSFTPVVNHPEVAILGISRGSVEPVHVEGAFQPRTMLPLSLSYDHRVIDGADGARFLRWVCDALEQPFVLTLQG